MYIFAGWVIPSQNSGVAIPIEVFNKKKYEYLS